MDTPRVEDPAGCTGCGRAIEVCGFCGEACGVELCYRCTLVELKETRPQPHPHGG